MASRFEDPTAWRLSTPVKDVPYKMYEGGRYKFDHYKGGGTLQVLIHKDYLQDFLLEYLPPPKQHGDITVPRFAYWGNSRLAVTSIQVEGHDKGLPIDPFADDPTAPMGGNVTDFSLGANTYCPILLLTLELAAPPQSEPDPNPNISPSPPLYTWLDISAQSAGEFVHSPPNNTVTEDIDDNGDPIADTEEPIRNPHIPITILVPETTWIVKWRQIPEFIYVDTVSDRLDAALGKVNSELFVLRKIHPKETLLLVDFEYERTPSWRDVDGDIVLVDVTMKFLQKEVKWKADPSDANEKTHGHQSFWIPGVGWRRVKMDDRYTFEETSFWDIFAPTV